MIYTLKYVVVVQACQYCHTMYYIQNMYLLETTVSCNICNAERAYIHLFFNTFVFLNKHL